MNKELISVIIPAYNAATTLPLLLDCLQAQTYRNFECIVIDDGSSDNTAEIAKNHPLKPRIIQQSNAGAPAARNRGAREAAGAYLLFCDADVTLKPEALQKMVDALAANPEASYAYSDYYFGNIFFDLSTVQPEDLRQRPYIHTTSLIHAKDFPGFDEQLQRFQDWDLWLTLLEQNKHGVYIPKTLLKVQTGGTMSSWLPSWIIESSLFSWLPQVKSYQAAKKIITTKHHLPL